MSEILAWLKSNLHPDKGFKRGYGVEHFWSEWGWQVSAEGWRCSPNFLANTEYRDGWGCIEIGSEMMASETKEILVDADSLEMCSPGRGRQIVSRVVRGLSQDLNVVVRTKRGYDEPVPNGLGLGMRDGFDPSKKRSDVRWEPGPFRLRFLGPRLVVTRDLLYDLSWLDRMRRPVEALHISAPVNCSVEPINRLSELRELRLWWSTYRDFEGVIRLGILPQLETLAVFGQTEVDWVGGGQRLRSLIVDRPLDELQATVEALPVLEHLVLAGGSFVPEVRSGMLRSLQLAFMDWPASDARMGGLESLEELELIGVDGIHDLSGFEGATRLRRIIIDDCQAFESLGGAPIMDGAEVILRGRTPAIKKYGNTLRWQR